MKKYFVMAFAFVAAIAMTSCKGGDDPAKDGVKISFTQKAYELGVGDTQRLSTTITPAGTELQLKYASSDATVATVSVSGIVTAVAEGTANIIVSAEGAEGDTCVITVSDMAIYNQFNIADYGLFGDFEMIDGTDTTITISIGEVKVKLAYITLIAWDGNIVYSSGWAGAGLAIQAPVTFWVITDDQADGKYNGYYIGAGGFAIRDIDAPRQAFGQAGSYDLQTYGDFWKALLNDEEGPEEEEAMPGARIMYIDYTDPENPSFSYGGYGHINSALFLEPEVDDKGNVIEEESWYCDLTWYNFTDDDRFLGLLVTVDAEGKLESIVEPYDMKTHDRFFSYNYEEESAAVHQLKLGNMSKLHKEVPAFATHTLPTDKLYKK